MRVSSIRLLAATFAVLSTGHVSAQIALQSGQTVRFDIPAAGDQQVVGNGDFFIETDENARNLLIQISDGGAGRDLDIFARRTPFSNASSPQSLLAEADYYAASSLGDEFFNIQEFAQPSVESNRWHIAVLGFAGDAVEASLTATVSEEPAPNLQFLVDFENVENAANCNTAPWNDSSPHTPIGGNNATTIGQARRQAMLEAANLLTVEYTTRVPIRIRACWRDFGGDTTTGITLASAGPLSLQINTPGLPQDIIYVQATATRLAGTDICRISGGDVCEANDVIINFNESAGDSFYYGLEAADSSTSGRDFITVALHEITHGLGFIELLGSDGAFQRLTNGQAVADAFSHNLATLNANGQPVRFDDPALSDADRAAAMVSFSNLLWFDDQASVQESNTIIDFRSGLIRMEAPAVFSSGSSTSHVSGAYCDLMRPSLALCRPEAIRQLDMTRRIMDGVGWVDSRNRPPFLGQYLDISRNGHGYDLQAAGTDDRGRDVYVLTFYTYETLGGAPEWYQAIGVFENGAFTGTRNPDANGFPRFTYDPANNPPQRADPDTFAQVAQTANHVEISVACNDGVDRSNALSTNSFQWAIDRGVDEWCTEPLVSKTSRPAPTSDFGGLWFAGAEDQGWGFSLENIVQPDGSVDLFVLLYVYAADGSPVWFFGLADDVAFGGATTVTMFQRQGYARTARNGPLSDTEAGTMTLTLIEPSNQVSAGNRVDVDVTYLGAEGGDWIRDDSPMIRLSLPRAGRD